MNGERGSGVGWCGGRGEQEVIGARMSQGLSGELALILLRYLSSMTRAVICGLSLSRSQKGSMEGDVLMKTNMCQRAVCWH